MQINKCNASHGPQNEEQKSCNHLNRCRKTFDTIPHSFIIEAMNKLGIEGSYLKVIKAVYDKPKSNIILNGEKLKAFPLRSGLSLIETKVSTLMALIQYSTGGKGTKSIQWRHVSILNKWCWGHWISTLKRLKFDSFLSPYKRNINSKT
jgi:hypothetical protein